MSELESRINKREKMNRAYLREQRIDAINKAIENGLTSVRAIMRETGLARSTIYSLASQEGIALHKGKIGRYKINQINQESLAQALANNVNSLEELCKIGGFRTHGGLWKYCNEHNIKLPNYILPWKTRPEIDVLIEQGLTQREIAKNVGLSFERIRQYINESGQYNEYMRIRKEQKELPKREEEQRKHLLKNIIYMLRERTRELAKKEGWACEKAVEYLYSTKDGGGNYRVSTTPFSDLQKIFKKYEDAVNKGKRIALQELADEIDTYPSQSRKILQRVGLEPMYGKKEMKIHYRGEKIEATNRGLKTDFSRHDIAYFLNLPEYIPGLRYNAMRIHRGKRSRAAQLGSKFLTYRLASQIYEAQDCGFLDEIAELADASDDIVDFALFLRKEVEPKIIKGLRVLYNDKTIAKPYVTKKMREKLEKEDR